METKTKEVEALEVKEPTEVKVAGVTQKTMKALGEQLKRCVAEELLDKEEVFNLTTKLRENWIAKNL